MELPGKGAKKPYHTNKVAMTSCFQKGGMKMCGQILSNHRQKTMQMAQ